MQLATCAAVDGLVQSAATEFGSDRRKNRRYPFFRPIMIDVDGAKFTAFSRDISATSIGLFHNCPIDEKSATLTIPTTSGREIEVTTDIRWYKPLSDGWHLSGARFVGTSVWRVPSLLLAIVASETHRRFKQRYPFFSAARIVTHGTNGTVLSGFTKDISTDGIGLLHNQPFDPQRVTLTLTRNAGPSTEIQTDIKWCRPCHEGWYISGGQFASLSFAELPELLS